MNSGLYWMSCQNSAKICPCLTLISAPTKATNPILGRHCCAQGCLFHKDWFRVLRHDKISSIFPTDYTALPVEAISHEFANSTDLRAHLSKLMLFGVSPNVASQLEKTGPIRRIAWRDSYPATDQREIGDGSVEASRKVGC